MTRYCANRDGNHTGELNVCAPCARRFREALASIAMDTPALLLIANRQADTGENDRTGIRGRSAHAPLLLREQAWELHCRAEQLVRLAALQCGCPPAVRRTAGISELARGILKDDRPLLAAPDARLWWRDVVDMAGKVNRAVDPPQTRVAFGACPFYPNGVVWGAPRAHMGECRSCGAQVNRTYVPDRLLDLLAKTDKKGTPKQYGKGNGFTPCLASGERTSQTPLDVELKTGIRLLGRRSEPIDETPLAIDKAKGLRSLPHLFAVVRRLED